MTKKTKIPEKKPSKKYRWLRIIGKILLGIFLFLFLTILFVRSEWGQGIIVNKAVNYLSNKTGTTVEIEKLFVTFDGDIMLEGLYLEDQKGDTLIYSRSLEADIPLIPMIRGNAMGIDRIDWEGVRANIIRKDTVSGFNFDFISAAFTSQNTNEEKSNTSNTESPKLIIGDVYLYDFDVVYNDSVTGIDSRYVVSELKVAMDEVNLEQMKFTAGDGVIRGSKITIEQYDVYSDPNADDIPLPHLVFESLLLDDVSGRYHHKDKGIDFKFDMGRLNAIVPMANFETFSIHIDEFLLENSAFSIAMTANDSASATALQDAISVFPDYNFLFKNVNITSTDVDYTVNGARPKKGIFNQDAIYIKDLEFVSPKIYLQDYTAGGTITRLNGFEQSGIHVRQFSSKFLVSDQALDLTGLTALINNNRIKGDIYLNYPSIEAISTTPEQVKLDLSLPALQLDLSDVFRFQPALAKNDYLLELSKNYIVGSLKASGSLSNIQIPNLQFNWGDDTYINGSGVLKNANDLDNLRFNFPTITASTTRDVITKFVATDSLSFNLPENFKIDASLSGGLGDFQTDATLITSQGELTLKGEFKSDSGLSYDANLEIKAYALGELLDIDQLGNVSLTINSKGSGKSINDLDATIEATIDSLGLGNYAIRDFRLNGSLKDGKGIVQSSYKDDNLNMTLASLVALDSVSPKATVNLNVVGANLQGLGVMRRDVRTGFKLEGYFRGNTKSFDTYATVNDGVFVYDNRTYLLGNLDLKARIRPNSTALTLENKLLDVDLRSNADPQRFAAALKNHIYSYFYRDSVLADTIVNPVNVNLKAKIKESPLLNEIFLVNMKDLDTVSVHLDFVEAERKLDAAIKAPHINYSGNELDSLLFTMRTDKDYFKFDLGFDGIVAGPLDINRTKISGSQNNNELRLDFEAYHEEEALINVSSEITGSRDRLRFHVLSDSLTFNKKNWTVLEGNEIILAGNKLAFNDFLFKRKGQSIEVTDKLPTIIKDHIAIDFQNFKLNELLSYLNPDNSLAQGSLSGDLVVEEPFGDLGLLADLYVDQFGVLGEDLGLLELSGRSLRGDKYDFNMAISGGSVDLTLEGDYIADVNGAQMNMDLDLNEVKMEVIDGFSLGELKEGSGDVSGNFKINGQLADLNYQGFLRFEDAGFTVTKLNAPFTLRRETISVDNKGVSMDSFTVRDVRGNKLVANGTIGTASFVNPTFDLGIVANDFEALNAKEGDNEFLYGKAVVDAKARIKGDAQIPIIAISATVGGSTDITYVMPTATANLESSQGIVNFVNRENPDAILTSSEEETGTIVGFDMTADIKVNKEAEVTILIDEETGDNLNVYGEGDFIFSLQPNGRMNLTGVYDVAGGKYEMNLYNLVNRTFTLDPSSRVSWSGDPFDAKLDVRAIYEVEASASALMAPAIAGSAIDTKAQFRQVLPFLVYLNIDGELLSPKINFALDLPEEEQGAFGGEIYSRIQQVNKQEGELNKQVFSLLVLNRFYPDPGSDGSRGGFASIARDNLNDALSDQLNIFSDKLLGNSGFNLDFGLDSFTDYSGTTSNERTQLDIAASRKFFDDKLKVSVGSSVDVQGQSASGEGTPLIGNVSLEYALTEDGQYRLRGFRRSEYENVIDGQTIVNGISIIFQQEFNQFSQLWDAILRKKQEELIAEKKAMKEIEPSQEKIDTNKID